MIFDRNTKLTDILAAYPWLPDELIKMNAGFGIIKSPIGKIMIKNATIADLSRKIGATDDEVIEKLREMIDRHHAT